MAKEESVADLRSEILFLRQEVSKLLAIAMGETADAERWRYIEDHASACGGGEGFEIKCWVPVDCEDMGCGVDAAIALKSTAPKLAGNGEGE
jgi:hypothetical protein